VQARRPVLRLILPVANPERNVGGLHRLSDDGRQLDSQFVQVDLVAQTRCEQFERPACVVFAPNTNPTHTSSQPAISTALMTPRVPGSPSGSDCSDHEQHEDRARQQHAESPHRHGSAGVTRLAHGVDVFTFPGEIVRRIWPRS
jgi:hypothetical protein